MLHEKRLLVKLYKSFLHLSPLQMLQKAYRIETLPWFCALWHNVLMWGAGSVVLSSCRLNFVGQTFKFAYTWLRISSLKLSILLLKTSFESGTKKNLVFCCLFQDSISHLQCSKFDKWLTNNMQLCLFNNRDATSYDIVGIGLSTGIKP